MTKYREILRLSEQGFSQQNIAYSCGVSKKTVNKVLKRAAEINLSWPQYAEHKTDGELCELLFPKNQESHTKSAYRITSISGKNS